MSGLLLSVGVMLRCLLLVKVVVVRVIGVVVRFVYMMRSLNIFVDVIFNLYVMVE